jgi:DNA-binding NarL/FixJ family response regulator
MKVLIADDHPVVRYGLKAMLEAHPDIKVVAEARNGREAVELARDTDWDVAVVDYLMPEQSGANGEADQTTSRPTGAGAERVPESLRASGREAAPRLRNRKAQPARERAKVACGGRRQRRFRRKAGEGLAAGPDRPPHEVLSERERQVIRLLAAGKLITEIGHELCVSPSAAYTYRARILRKLKLSNTAELVRYAVKYPARSVSERRSLPTRRRISGPVTPPREACNYRRPLNLAIES